MLLSLIPVQYHSVSSGFPRSLFLTSLPGMRSLCRVTHNALAYLFRPSAQSGFGVANAYPWETECASRRALSGLVSLRSARYWAVRTLSPPLDPLCSPLPGSDHRCLPSGVPLCPGMTVSWLVALLLGLVGKDRFRRPSSVGGNGSSGVGKEIVTSVALKIGNKLRRARTSSFPAGRSWCCGRKRGSGCKQSLPGPPQSWSVGNSCRPMPGAAVCYT